MNRRRSKTSWLQRWARPLIGGIAILGAINTAYITATKLFGGETACPTSGCEQVLSSEYATIFGQPLALFGLIAYLAMAIFALGPLLVNPTENKVLRFKAENTTWLLLFLGATAMAIFSSYLMYIMVTEFVMKFGSQAVCVYCIASAIFAFSMLLLTILGRAWEDIGQLVFGGIIVTVVTLIATLAIYAPINQSITVNGQNVEGAYVIKDPTTGKAEFTVTEASGEAEIELAKHLKNADAKMYGAFWCSHCYTQKRWFGVEAIQEIPYIECAKKGRRAPLAPECATAFDKVKAATGQDAGFPTWEVNGQYYSGMQPLDQLAAASGYQGPTDFQHSPTSQK